ncbi:TPA: ABC transporter permease [Candidatus Sumerlaeota bacterium]|jgi:phospholipid/cholesterol/gamma-HCH transport system permease protein|nr:ABC transporter permease [Candidatus Sumerlaeota bacterium]
MLLFRPIHALFYSLFLKSGQVVALFFQTLAELGSLSRHWASTFKFMLQFGLYTLPLATLIGFFVGMVTALQTGMELKKLGLTDLMVGPLVGISLMREMGPVITAVIVTGRVGAAMTAEIGTMVVTEEVDVLRSLGIHPVGFLVVPRFFAAMLMVPALTVYSILAGIWGGAMVATNYLNVSSAIYYDKLFSAIKRIDIESGMCKTFVFAAIISIVCCYCGLSTTRGAEGVGRSTMSAVVISLSSILIADYFMTRFVGIG